MGGTSSISVTRSVPFLFGIDLCLISSYGSSEMFCLVHVAFLCYTVDSRYLELPISNNRLSRSENLIPA